MRQQTCLLRYTADMSAMLHSSHVCCVTQQTCPPACDNKPWFCIAPTTQLSAMAHARLTVHKEVVWCRMREAACPPLLQYKTTVSCRKQKRWAQTYNLLLDPGTCLTPEAQNWTALTCRPQLNHPQTASYLPNAEICSSDNRVE